MLRFSHGRGVWSSAAGRHDSISPAGDFAGRALPVLFLCALAAMAVYGLAPTSSTPAKTCESLGRAGAFCRSASFEGASVKTPDPRRKCQSLGRGGLVCTIILRT